MQFLRQTRNLSFYSMILTPLFMSLRGMAEEMMGGKMSCHMCGAMGWGGMILGGVLILATIGVLVSLTIYLIRRSRTLPQ